MAVRRPASARPPRQRFIVVTGLSGAGKSQAIHALEDLGYFCVDNLPIALIPTFADLMFREDSSVNRAAVVVDIREAAQLSRFPAVYRRIKRRPDLKAQLVFLEANQRSLLRRFSETRRPHPLARTRSAAEGLEEERRRLGPIRRLSDRTIDTSNLSVHDLRREMVALAGGAAPRRPLVVNILSFGFKHGVPADADLLFDVRFLQNPHFVPRLRRLTGASAQVSRYVMGDAAAGRFLQLTAALLRFLLPQYIDEGKTYLTVAIGCTGGRHRSVTIGAALGRRLAGVRGVQVRLRHRDVAEG